MPRLFCFGLGYSARALADRLRAEGWAVAGTCRSAEKREALRAAGIDAFLFDRARPLADTALKGATHVLISVPPDRDGDPVLARHKADIIAGDGIAWLGYLSTTGVYGDCGGNQVDESSPLKPTSERSRARVQAEAGWLDLHRRHDLPVHVFRLAGIYGPGRSAIDQAREGRIRRIEKPGHLFSRIHLEDIANVLAASIARPAPGAVYNVCDDAAAPQADVIAYACELLGLPVPPAVPFDEAKKEMTEMALSFWRDNRRVCNRRIKEELGLRLSYPTYREGLAAIANGVARK